ncbi:hypothetical protein KIN20_036458 [Parelaphostrongylus tenuis]|uniref:Syndetin C-terminal domain-containing protein n=1 Tax=Parelaphostrongylus tenuis TaxID=148309 RepID=A0AAD5WLP1_PARTN|nr:hypothetical protein KIN20_036458 [Parelaphostrongylus tenuis]
MVESIEQMPTNICNTALNLLRFLVSIMYECRYIRMTSLLPSISEYSIPALTELFEYFFYGIILFFGSDGPGAEDAVVKLKAVLDEISAHFLFGEAGSSNKLPEERLRFATPKICVGLDLSNFDQLYGIAERIVAVESVEFVARQLYLVRPVMESLLPKQSEKITSSLDRFYGSVLSVVGDTRCLVYSCVTSRALNFSLLIRAISNTKWDVDELQSHHSGYVDIVIKDFQEFSLRLERATKSIHVSDSVRTLLWDQTIFYTFKALVQGYCESGRCSTEGRALMQLDFQHLLLKLEPICGLHPIPHCSFVEGYIKAFYLPENGLEEWIHKHSEYTSKQMISLLGVATHVSRKARTRIIML